MAELVNKTLEVVSALPLQSLEGGWVKECWDNHFLDVTPLPLVTENLLQDEGYCVNQLENLLDVARQWHTVDSDTEGLWTCLLENSVSHKALVALLAHLMPMEHSIRTIHGRKKEASFMAATLYLSLVGLPGSRAFKVYSPDLLLRAVNLLKINAALGEGGRKKRTVQPVRSSQPSRSQPSKRSRNTTRNTTIIASQNSSNDIEDDESGDDDDDDDLSPSQVQRFSSLYLNLLSELVSLLSSFSLRESSNTVDQVIKALTILTRVDNHAFDGQFPLQESRKRLGQSSLGITALAFKGLQCMCQPIHGEVKTLTTTTCKHLLPVVLMLLDGNKVCATPTLPAQLQHGRQHAITFVRYLLREIGQDCLPSVKILLQHVCMKVPDKSDYRIKAAQSVVTLLEDFPDPQYAFMLKWIGVLSRNEKSTVRAFSLEVLTLLLSQPDRQLQGVTEEEQSWASQTALISQLLARCSDVAAAVRTRAITGFAHCLEGGGVTLLNTLRDLMTPRNTAPRPPRLDPTPDGAIRTVRQADRTADESGEGTSNAGDKAAAEEETGEKTQGDNTSSSMSNAPLDSNDKPNTPFRSVALAEGLNNSLPDRQGVISMLHRRAREDKVYVRKAALQALHNLILFEAPADIGKEDLEVLVERCRDKAVSVRKQALTSLNEVLQKCLENTAVHSAWLRGVLAMVWDQESSVQEKCVDTVENVLLSAIVPLHRSKGEQHSLAWQLLTLISKPEHNDLRRHFKKLCRLWERTGKLKASLITSLLSHIDTENNEAAWSVLADIATTKVKVDVKPVLKFWDNHHHDITGSTEGGMWENVLRIISFKAEAVPADHRTKLIDDFKGYLMKFYLNSVLVSALATAVHQLSGVGGGREAKTWGRDILQACDQALSILVLDQDTTAVDVSMDEERVMCQLYTLGVVALLCPSVTPKRTPLLVQSFIASPCLTAQGDSSANLSGTSQPLHTTHGSEVNEEGSQQATEGSQGSSQGSQGSQGSQFTQALSQFRGCKMSDRVRAVAFLSLGKLCLQDKMVAKKCVPAMARELELSSSDSVRNNVIIILRDLCVRYTTLVDPYVSAMAACLRDPAPIVRRQTLELLTGLLQEDYLKWKGSLFFRFALTLLDPHPDIAAFGEFCLGFHLLKRHPALMSQHLLESIFVFNDYTQHNVFNKYTQTDRERELFSLKGEENQCHRYKLYQFMLEHMEDEHRFQLTSKITQEVLGVVVDGLLPFDQDSIHLLKDALHILSSKEIKLSSLRSNKQVEDAADDQEMAQAVMATARKTLITQVVKRNVMENVLPTVLALKHMLDKERSPLLKDLMEFLRELMKDYKNEIKDILASDPQLACEVEYDLRMFEQQQNNPDNAPQAANFDQTPGGGRVTPQGCRPGTPGPRPTTPTALPQRDTPPTHTPDRQTTPASDGKGTIPQQSSSATRQAVLRTLEQLKLRRQSSGNKRDQRRLSSVKWAENVIASTSDAEQESSDKPQTPQPARRPLRAISTPSGLLSNVTFAEENNLTLPLVPPSPIPQSSNEVDDVTGEEENEEVDIIFMDMPGAQGQAKPRGWKVKVKTEKQVEEASKPAIVNSPVVSRTRRSRQES